MPDFSSAAALRAPDGDEAAAIVRAFCEPLPSPKEAEEFGAFFDRFADAKVVLLGEASHGTSQFYRARAAITRRLIEKHGLAGRRADRPPRPAPCARTNVGRSLFALPDLDVGKCRCP
jgi:hypothetical protein